MTPKELTGSVLSAINTERLVETAMALSLTRSARAVADRLAEIIQDDGFAVERPEARGNSGKPPNAVSVSSSGVSSISNGNLLPAGCETAW